MRISKRKKDFKIREDIAREFEIFAPSGRQTAIVEGLISAWVEEQKKHQRALKVRQAYYREMLRKGKKGR